MALQNTISIVTHVWDWKRPVDTSHERNTHGHGPLRAGAGGERNTNRQGLVKRVQGASKLLAVARSIFEMGYDATLCRRSTPCVNSRKTLSLERGGEWDLKVVSCLALWVSETASRAALS